MENKTLYEHLAPLNLDETFYKEYYLAGARQDTLQTFLDTVDIEDAKARHLVIPELLP